MKSVKRLRSEVYVKFLEKDVIGYAGWDQEGWLDASVTSRTISTEPFKIVEAVSIGSSLGRLTSRKEHYFRGDCSANELEKAVEQLGYDILWKQEKDDILKRNTNGWLMHWDINWKDVIDPDGWDRRNLETSLDELITLEEFELRMAQSTCRSTRKIRSFFERRKTKHYKKMVNVKNKEQENIYEMLMNERKNPNRVWR